MSAFSYLANQPAVFAIATMLLVASTTARAVDVEFYVIAKDEGFNQSSAAPPAPKGNPFRFNAIVGLSTPNSVTSASVRSLPGGQVEPLTAQLYSFELQAKFPDGSTHKTYSLHVSPSNEVSFRISPVLPPPELPKEPIR